MTDTRPETAGVPDGEEAFAALVLRYLDGLATADETAGLNAALLSGRSCRELFVRLCRLDGVLREAYVPLTVRLDGSEKAAGQTRAARRKKQARAAHARPAAPGTATAGPAGTGRRQSGKKGTPGAATRNTKLLAEETAYPPPTGQGQTPPEAAGTGPAPDRPDDVLRLLGMLDEEPERTE